MPSERDVIERIILGAIYAWSTTPAEGIAAAKASGVDADAFTTEGRRLMWLIANAESRERAIELVRLAVSRGELDPATEWLTRSWGPNPTFFGQTPADRIRRRAGQLRELVLKGTRPTLTAALAQLRGLLP